MPDGVAAVQELPEWQAWATLETAPAARVCPLPSSKTVEPIVRFQPAPEPRASTTPSTGAYVTVWSEPSSVSVNDGFDGRDRLTPAVPETVAVAVSVPATAAAVATSAAAVIARRSKSLCRIRGSFLPRIGDVRLPRIGWRRTGPDPPNEGAGTRKTPLSRAFLVKGASGQRSPSYSGLTGR